MGKKKARARKNVRKRDEYAEVIPAKKKRGPPRDRAARRAPEPTDADREAELKRLRTFLKRRDVARSATDDWTVRFDDDGKFAYVSAAGEAYTTKTAVLRALAPADVDAGPSAAQVWGASRPGAEDQAIAALVDGLVAELATAQQRTFHVEPRREQLQRVDLCHPIPVRRLCCLLEAGAL